ncbi:TadE/TadG family type IV pilus assembly protein [Nocardioides rubriscoriae]|uniref:TadE/TadG family type IV pilus assembly protein n=1 Tax=Nocardioides rubriscoriae TaxID=642762 RepID=UPI0011DF6D08|nr:TadE/TadG family type IV pilus assembly protein [Nocardioides rubriscoriae]
MAATGAPARRRDDDGAAVVDFVLVLVVLVPLVLGILQLALVLHVRNTLASAAAEGARYAAVQGRGPGDGEARTRSQIDGAVSGRFADDITVRRIVVGGVSTIEVVVRAKVPALGLGGPAVQVEVEGHAVQELP